MSILSELPLVRTGKERMREEEDRAIKREDKSPKRFLITSVRI